MEKTKQETLSLFQIFQKYPEPIEIYDTDLCLLQDTFFDLFATSLYICPMTVYDDWGKSRKACFYLLESDRKIPGFIDKTEGFILGFVKCGEQAK